MVCGKERELLGRAERELGEKQKAQGSELVCMPKMGTTDGNYRENGWETIPPASVPIPTNFFMFLFFFVETVYGRFLWDSMPIGTRFSHPVFNLNFTPRPLASS